MTSHIVKSMRDKPVFPPFFSRTPSRAIQPPRLAVSYMFLILTVSFEYRIPSQVLCYPIMAVLHARPWTSTQIKACEKASSIYPAYVLANPRLRKRLDGLQPITCQNETVRHPHSQEQQSRILRLHTERDTAEHKRHANPGICFFVFSKQH